MPVRLRILLALLAVVPLGHALEYRLGPLGWWADEFGSGVAYVLFFVLAIALFVPRRRAILPIAVGVCLVTCLLEVLQLWRPPALEAARATFPGRVLLGTSFDWWDFPAYPAGAVLGWLMLRALLPACSGSERADRKATRTDRPFRASDL